MHAPLHSLTWLVWALAGAAVIQLAPSPVYVALTVAAVAVVVAIHGLDSPLRRAFPALIAIGAAFALVRVALTALTTHGTGGTLFTLPEATMPRLLGGFTVGGTVELPVVLQTAAEGFVILGVMAVFGAFNSVVSHYELVRSAPRAFYEMGLVVTVALAIVPSTLMAITAVREADKARTGGRVVRRGRLLRLVVPVLESGLERAMTLAESMDSRGFARRAPSKREQASAWVGLAALFALGATFVALVGQARLMAIGLAMLGIGGVGAAVALASGRDGPTRYRRNRLAAADIAVMVVSVVAPAAVAAMALLDNDTLHWSAFPPAPPGFRIEVGLALLALLAPVAVRSGLRTAGSHSGLPEPAPV